MYPLKQPTFCSIQAFSKLIDLRTADSYRLRLRSLPVTYPTSSFYLLWLLLLVVTFILCLAYYYPCPFLFE